MQRTYGVQPRRPPCRSRKVRERLKSENEETYTGILHSVGTLQQLTFVEEQNGLKQRELHNVDLHIPKRTQELIDLPANAGAFGYRTLEERAGREGDAVAVAADRVERAIKDVEAYRNVLHKAYLKYSDQKLLA